MCKALSTYVLNPAELHQCLRAACVQQPRWKLYAEADTSPASRIAAGASCSMGDAPAAVWLSGDRHRPQEGRLGEKTGLQRNFKIKHM